MERIIDEFENDWGEMPDFSMPEIDWNPLKNSGSTPDKVKEETGNEIQERS